MKSLFCVFFATAAALPAQSLASTDPNANDGGLAIILFLGFIGIIIVGQLIPGLRLFFSMIKGLFKKSSNQINSANHK